ncbi:uncharacterized protein [Diadema antillarum]|uniref:uncharacterized protein n=1 Tax=Diadema antillarum TaxID=105358 RepID=UPI003A8A9BBA
MAGDCCDNGCCNTLWRYYSPFVRTCGVVVAAVLWAIGVTNVASDLFYIYILVTAFIVSVLELLIFVAPCCDRCCSREGRCYVFWEYMSWLDNWKRAILYLVLSVFCYIRYRHPLAIVSGAILDFLALVYIIRTYRIQPEDDLAEEETGQTRVGSRTYGRFHNEDAKRSMATPSTASDESRQSQYRSENEARYPGGEVEPQPPNPFEGEPKDDEVDPAGDAGLTRYPP